MYVHADRGASRATKTSVRATNVKHVDTREHTDEPRQRTHRERGGERAESAGLRSLSLSPSLSFFLPSIDAASLFLRSSLCSSRWVPRWLHVLIFLYNRLASAREENPYKPIPVRVQCRCIRIFAYIMPPRSVPVFHPPSTPRFYRFYLSIYLSSSPRICMHTDIALQVRRRTGRSAWFCTRACRERERGRGSRERSLWFPVSLAERADRSREKRRRWRWRGIDVGIRGRSGGGNAASISERRKLREFCPKGHFFLATRKGGT